MTRPQLAQLCRQAIQALAIEVALAPCTVSASTSLKDLGSNWHEDESGLLCRSSRRIAAQTAVGFLAEIESQASSIIIESPCKEADEPWFDYNWAAYMTYPEPGERTYAADGVVDATLAISVRTSALKESTAAARASLVSGLCDLVAATGHCYVGFVDCENARDTNAVMLYTDVPVMPVARWVLEREEGWWNAGPARRELIKYLHWGMFLGRGLTARLCERLPSFLSSYPRWTPAIGPDEVTIASDHVLRLLPEQLWLSLSGDVLDASRQYGWMGTAGNRGSQLALWIRQQFGPAGLLR
ncbi:hypothetical protein PHYC_03349 [Phycisphaerales bacterium]|nr:hypothetical protein PHYC_03349 [Phycisphaerales bacterium]